ncbi:MAG TPA: DUF6288 domain-containing protein [Planctomycetaceae bacterium]|nr:DUF6288 domain-containing protein [Planctomycetaceae bacterium]
MNCSNVKRTVSGQIHSTIGRFLVFVTLALTFAAADAAEPYRPKLTNDKAGNTHDFPLGVMSATGRLADGASVIEIIDLAEDGAATEGGLQAGDGIYGVGRKTFGPYSKNLDTGLLGPQAALAAELDRGCAKDPPQIQLMVVRGDEKLKLDVPLPASPSFARTFPERCEKTAAYRKGIEAWLVENQTPQGFWKGGLGGDDRDYSVPYCGLVLLAAGNPEYLPQIRKAVEFVRQGAISKIDLEDVKKGPKNWIAASVAILLAEYHLATGDTEVIPDLQKCCDLLAKRVSPTGTMGHHWEITYGGGGLTIINAHAHLAWSLAAHCGCKLDSGAWNRSLVEIGKSMTRDGAVGYSSRAVGDNDAPARTGGIATALVISQQHPELAQPMGRWLMAKNNRMRHAHAMTSVGLIFGTTGIKSTGGSRALKTHLNNWLPYLELSRSAAGSAMYFPSKRNFGGDSYLGLQPIGNAIVGLMLASTEDNLFLFGGKKKTWLIEAE